MGFSTKSKGVLPELSRLREAGGGSLLSIGSAAGVGLMGTARGVYTFGSHLKWSWAVALGYAAAIASHLLINAGSFHVFHGKKSGGTQGSPHIRERSEHMVGALVPAARRGGKFVLAASKAAVTGIPIASAEDR
jgi:hypothetical protein